MSDQMRHLTGSNAGRWATIAVCLSGLEIVGAPAVAAHAGLPLAPHDLPRVWNVSVPLLGSLLLAAWLYTRGVAACWGQAGRGRIVPEWRAWAFAAGLVALALALLSPLDALAGALFSAHMVQHVVLTLVAAPLLLLGSPTLVIFWALPTEWRRRVGRSARRSAVRLMRFLAANAVVVSLLYALALWAWHLPRLYEAALSSALMHALEHGTLLGAALLFWGFVIHAPGGRLVIQGIGIMVAFVAMLHGTVLSAMITFAGTAWYATYAAGTAAWGLTPIDDQRLAGALMMMLSGLAYVSAAVLALTGWLSAAEQRRVRGLATGAITPSTAPLRWHKVDAP
jgi:cytochrome c oxidase assembly factor CtaG